MNCNYTCILFIPVLHLKWNLLYYLTAKLNSVKANVLMFLRKIQHKHPFIHPVPTAASSSAQGHRRSAGAYPRCQRGRHGDTLDKLPMQHTQTKSSTLDIMIKIYRIRRVFQSLTSCLNDSTCINWSAHVKREKWNSSSIFFNSGTVSHSWVTSEKQPRHVRCQIRTQSAATTVWGALVNCLFRFAYKILKQCFFFSTLQLFLMWLDEKWRASDFAN